jgi:transcriptional regulator with XRE-family HTH domain
MFVKLRGEEVRAWRVSRDLSREQFAEMAGVGQSTLANLERGAAVRLGTARKVAGVLGVEVRSLGRPSDFDYDDAPPGLEKFRYPSGAIVEPLRRTAFGRVLSGLVESRDIPATPGRIGVLASSAGLDGWKVINRMASTRHRYVGRRGAMRDLAAKLDLNEEERDRLAMALSFEEE